MPKTTELSYRFRAGEAVGDSSQALTLKGLVTSSTPQGVALEAVGFTILAASIQPALGTDTLTITIGGTTVTAHLAKQLPSMTELVNLFNATVADAFSTETEPLPVMVAKSGGYVIRNTSTVNDAEFTFTSNSAVLWLSGQSLLTNNVLTIPAGTETDIFLPSPRLGAQFQTARVGSGGRTGVKLPLSGSFMASGIYYPVREYEIGLSYLSNTCSVQTVYPAVGATIIEKPLTDTQFVFDLKQ